MDTDLLRTFIEVSKTRHFGRAAENLYLTQSAVSFRIRQLEQQLGVSLFARHRNNIQLTQSGEHLLPYAETILQTLGRAALRLLIILQGEWTTSASPARRSRRRRS
jgi:DNA-binding transcriptional LysR family regulator